jgi:hypothetical protein
MNLALLVPDEDAVEIGVDLLVHEENTEGIILDLIVVT